MDIQISFSKSSSNMYKKVIKLCCTFKGYSVEDSMNILRLNFIEASDNWEVFNTIFLTTYKWSSFRLIVKGRAIAGPEIKTIFYSLQELKYCINRFDKEIDKLEYCDGGRYWGCQRLKSVKVLPDFYTIDQGWYTIGHLENGAWKIDKERILSKLLKEAQNSFIDNCPNFSAERIKIVVNALPDELDIATKHWKLSTGLKFIDGKFQTVCTGIQWQGSYSEFRPETFLQI